MIVFPGPSPCVIGVTWHLWSWQHCRGRWNMPQGSWNSCCLIWSTKIWKAKTTPNCCLEGNKCPFSHFFLSILFITAANFPFIVAYLKCLDPVTERNLLLRKCWPTGLHSSCINSSRWVHIMLSWLEKVPKL